MTLLASKIIRIVLGVLFALIALLFLTRDISTFTSGSPDVEGKINEFCSDTANYAECNHDFRFDKILWFITDGHPRNFANESFDEVYNTHSNRLCTYIPGLKYSHTVYSGWLVGRYPYNIGAETVSMDTITAALARGGHKVRYHGPEWSFALLNGRENYGALFEQTDFYPEIHTVPYTRPYPGIFGITDNTVEQRKKLLYAYLDDVNGHNQSLIAHSAVFDHEMHTYPRWDRRTVHMGKLSMDDHNLLKAWVDEHPEYLLVISSDHGVDEGPGGTIIHGITKDGNSGYFIFYNPRLPTVQEAWFDVSDVAATVASFMANTSIPEASIGVPGQNFGKTPEGIMAQFKTYRLAARQMMDHAKVRGVRLGKSVRTPLQAIIDASIPDVVVDADALPVDMDAVYNGLVGARSALSAVSPFPYADIVWLCVVLAAYGFFIFANRPAHLGLWALVPVAALVMVILVPMLPAAQVVSGDSLPVVLSVEPLVALCAVFLLVARPSDVPADKPVRVIRLLVLSVMLTFVLNLLVPSLGINNGGNDALDAMLDLFPARLLVSVAFLCWASVTFIHTFFVVKDGGAMRPSNPVARALLAAPLAHTPLGRYNYIPGLGLLVDMPVAVMVQIAVTAAGALISSVYAATREIDAQYVGTWGVSVIALGAYLAVVALVAVSCALRPRPHDLVVPAALLVFLLSIHSPAKHVLLLLVLVRWQLVVPEVLRDTKQLSASHTAFTTPFVLLVAWALLLAFFDFAVTLVNVPVGEKLSLSFYPPSGRIGLRTDNALPTLSVALMVLHKFGILIVTTVLMFTGAQTRFPTSLLRTKLDGPTTVTPDTLEPTHVDAVLATLRHTGFVTLFVPFVMFTSFHTALRLMYHYWDRDSDYEELFTFTALMGMIVVGMAVGVIACDIDVSTLRQLADRRKNTVKDSNASVPEEKADLVPSAVRVKRVSFADSISVFDPDMPIDIDLGRADVVELSGMAIDALEHKMI
ncbi:hypothetical protein J8273_0455 [Carpediemonas membranifera]|uniref:Uncharacterized protein n=1 Tax=Carpediemonas membranifera TaxID=201153 RepID=A0A8J6AZK5_9EUKA|nr:hypothetical protein J8273_0455 [Carpediemonas membranifera]|eukprot:KAG9395235.1 hypothetical protein J8273_0455 [Carpediemonas membranifera]